ncbi:DNA mismatch repair protein MutT [Streptomyces umbrinus]|nr:DNA mismatch repair protein MutT [Streptomyces umbrinus]
MQAEAPQGAGERSATESGSGGEQPVPGPGSMGEPSTVESVSAGERAVPGPDELGELRKVARVVLLDPQDRILLLHGHEPEDPSDNWWFTPGGGVEGDETREEAARRELVEETGITEVELGPVLWRRTCSFPFAGRRWDQEEWYYLARTTQTATEATGLTELERRSVAGARWWTCQELNQAHETVYPTRLAELLRRLLDEGPPAGPETLDTEIV